MFAPTSIHPGTALLVPEALQLLEPVLDDVWRPITACGIHFVNAVNDGYDLGKAVG
jgi:hypothetical protein